MRLLTLLAANGRLGLLALAVLLVPAASAATITVTTTADELNSDGDCSLREAVASANTDASVDACSAGSGADVVTFAVTLTGATITLTNGQLDITSNVFVDGGIVPNVLNVTLNGNAASRLFRAAGGSRLTLRSLRLTNGRAETGGVVLAEAGSTVSLDAVTAWGNEATGAAGTQGGGVVYADGATVMIVGSTFFENTATGTSGSGGALFNKSGSMSITGSTFTANTSNRAGGAIEDNASVLTSLTDVTLDGNNTGTNPGNGGGLHVTGAGTVTVSGGMAQNNVAVEGGAFWCATACTMTITGGTIQSNTASGSDGPTQGGGGLYNDGTLMVTNATVQGNQATGTAGSGGGILNVGGTLTVTGGVLVANTAIRAGGGIETNAGSVTLNDVDFTSNVTGASPGNGGALHVTGAGTVTATNGEVRTNTASREGGGFWNGSGTMNLTGTLFDGNVASGPAADDGGGGLFNDGGTLLLSAVTVQNNTATGAAGSGGGVFNNNGALTVMGGMISANTAVRAGGGIESLNGTTTLNSAFFVGNATGASPGNGGALHISGSGTVTATDGEVRTNTASREGGGFWNGSGTMTLTGTLFDGNEANGPAGDDGGGGVFNNGGTLVMDGVTVQNNTALGTAGSGGGVMTLGGSMRITGGTITGNQANRAGAGIENANGTVTMTDVTVTANAIPAASTAPGNGGGLHSGGGVVTVNGGTFTGNVANEGGGLWSNAILRVQPSEAGPALVQTNVGRGNAATQGGGGVFVETGGDVRLFGVEITDNQASGTSGSGGGLFVADGSAVVIEGGVVNNNQANRAGAGIEVADDGATSNGTAIVITWATIDGNTIATAAPGNGGGLHIGGAGAATIRKTTISNNAANEGGGAWIAGTGVLDLALSTVSGNTSVTEGGGIYDNGGASSATITIASATVVSNTAASGGGLYSQSPDGASFVLDNSIVGDNMATTGPDCVGMVRSGGHNLFEAVAGCTISGATALDITGADPALGPLADNGGPTWSHLPLSGSPVVNTGETAYMVDQRDFLRVVGQQDIGAIERGAMAVGTEPDLEQGEVAFEMSAPAPNPARGQATVRFTLDETQAARVTLHDVLGREVAVLFADDAAAGAEQTVHVPLDGLSAGVYLLRLESAGHSALQRLTVVR